MIKHRRLFVCSLTALGTVTAVLSLAWAGVLTPVAPAGWKAVHAGMDREAVLSLAGAPQQTGWPEKIIETWERPGLICHRRLAICYRGDGSQDGYVQSVYEGTWLRGYGWVHPTQGVEVSSAFSNKPASGNGAITRQFHFECLGRAVPEPIR